jgi:hypothetical protein
MNLYFQSLLQADKKRKRIKVTNHQSFPLFSGKFKAKFLSVTSHFYLRISKFKIGFGELYYPWFFDSDVKVKDCLDIFMSKNDVNSEIEGHEFRGKNIFLRLEERWINNLASLRE